MVDATAIVPEEIAISGIDLSVLIGNLLDNAMEACMEISNEQERFIRIYIDIIKNKNYKGEKMIDLHIHTNHSDGTDSVEELLKKAEAKKLEVISITDHDSVGAYYELEEKPELRKLFSGKIIIGSEFKTCYKRVPIEILGYGIDYKKIRIPEVDDEKMQKEILEQMKKTAKKLEL